MTLLGLTSSAYILSIPEIAELIGLTEREVRGKANRFNWQSTGERIQGGGDKYNINKITFYKSKEKHKEAIAKITAKISAREARNKLIGHGIELPEEFPVINLSDINHVAVSYANAPEYNRRKFTKYARIEQEAGLLEGRELETWIKTVWNSKNPKLKTSYKSVMRERKKVKEQGKTALIGQLGKRAGQTSVPSIYFEYFKSLALKEGGPSYNSCWRQVVGRYCPGGDLSSFPSVDSFLRRLNKEVGESAIYLARNGFAKWNRKYASYIERDYTKIKAGEIWVSDHAQIDVAVKSKDGKIRKVVFGWITSFIDMKTGKALSKVYHEEAPNSDHIFQAFFIAADLHGLPEYLYIDNGKDYRCRDFAGGRTYVHRVQVDEGATASMLCALNVIPIFAAPYNAQAKVIERWHLKIKTELSKHAEGYRGGNVTERPERLAEDIKRGNILDFDTFEALLHDFIFNVLNKMPSQGKGCNGLSPDDAWNSENPVKRTVTREALKLFCSRTTQPLTIGRNGVRYSKFDVTYFADWMIPRKGEKVYMRIAPDNVNDAWFFTPENDEYLGNANIKGLTHPVAVTEIDRAELREAIASKRREEKTAKSLGYVKHSPDTAERLSNMKAAVNVFNPEPVTEPERTTSRILPNSSMQKAVNIRKQQDNVGKSDLSSLARATEIEAKKRELAQTQGKILQFACDKPAKERKIKELEEEIKQLQAM